MCYRNKKLKFLDKNAVTELERRLVNAWANEGGTG